MTIFYFILAAISLGILVFIHELGHYFVAKWTKMKVEVFSIGFGRPLLKWRWNDVDWQLGWLPFGGYVKIAGMELGKKDKSTYADPYEVPNGFFSTPPWKRMLVAMAGPFANFILALFVFFAIWGMGGREKPFSDFTKIVGWVEPGSPAYTKGLRPGDVITHYNGKKYTGPKDLLYATMLSGEKIDLQGFHVNYASGQKTPFSLTVDSYAAPQSLDGILTTGIGGARYLIYDKIPSGASNPLPEGSPMEESGIQYQDRVVWADGEILFSMDQLSHILNSEKTLLTVRRKDEIFLTRQPRVHLSDLILPSYVRNELLDWQYETKIKGRLQDLVILPYVVNTMGYIEAPLRFIETESSLAAFSKENDIEAPLQPGDRIIAVDGIAVDHGYTILQLLQEHRVLMMVKKGVPLATKVSWKIEDQVFDQSLDVKAIEQLAAGIGTPDAAFSLGDYTLLQPVAPKRIAQFATTSETKQRLQAEYAKQREEVAAIKDQEKRIQAMRYLDRSYDRLILGIVLQDRYVNYNPSPLVMFGNIFKETGLTLKALVTGYLNPKWLGGPIGIVQIIQHGWNVGLGEALFWVAAISINLGFLNLLPIPVLDGGYICLSLWEMITRRRLKPKTIERLIIPFVILLIALLVFLTFQDISRFF